MALIGYLLKLTGQTNYFIIEMLVLVFPIMPIFILTEKNYKNSMIVLEEIKMNILMIEDNQSVSEMMQMFF